MDIISNNIYTIDQIKYLFSPIFRNYGVKKAVLFGSYGQGNAKESSDIDLMVDSQLRGLKFVGLIEELRNTAEKNVDLFDITHIETNSKIEEEIKKTGVLIYEE